MCAYVSNWNCAGFVLEEYVRKSKEKHFSCKLSCRLQQYVRVTQRVSFVIQLKAKKAVPTPTLLDHLEIKANYKSPRGISAVDIIHFQLFWQLQLFKHENLVVNLFTFFIGQNLSNPNALLWPLTRAEDWQILQSKLEPRQSYGQVGLLGLCLVAFLGCVSWPGDQLRSGQWDSQLPASIMLASLAAHLLAQQEEEEQQPLGQLRSI